MDDMGRPKEILSLMNIFRSSIPLIVFLSTHTAAFGQSDSPKNDQSQQLKQVFHDVAANYEITAGAGSELKRLALRDEPIMQWLSGDGTNGIYVGSVFVWTREQRPEIVGTIFNVTLDAPLKSPRDETQSSP